MVDKLENTIFAILVRIWAWTQTWVQFHWKILLNLHQDVHHVPLPNFFRSKTKNHFNDFQEKIRKNHSFLKSLIILYGARLARLYKYEKTMRIDWCTVFIIFPKLKFISHDNFIMYQCHVTINRWKLSPPNRKKTFEFICENGFSRRVQLSTQQNALEQ